MFNIFLLLASAGVWTPAGVLIGGASLLVSVGIVLYGLRRVRLEREQTVEAARKTKEKERNDKLDEVVLALVGRPADTVNGFAKINGLQNKFDEHVKETRERAEKVDTCIAEIQDGLARVAAEYVTNGGSTVKDDLVTLRQGQASLLTRQSRIDAKVESLLQGQGDAAKLAANVASDLAKAA